tara:strand:- start:2036 stop:2893 length:858 start_codon:yes stop_codon:yes gene_type:complete
MIGLSTTYYAKQGFSVYESVLKVVELGFEVVELGASHAYEDDIPVILRKIKRDFPNVNFTIHTLFPPLREMTWFNPADGLNETNKKIVDGLFEAASIVDALLISIHTPVLNEIKLRGENVANLCKVEIGRPKDIEICKKKFFELMKYISGKSDTNRTKVIIENMGFINSLPISFYPYTREDFLGLFEMFPDTGLLLDVGHAKQYGNLQELISLDGKICEIHLHDIGATSGEKGRGHSPIKDIAFFEPLRELMKKDSLIFVFEHDGDCNEDEVLIGKKLLEKVLAG